MTTPTQQETVVQTAPSRQTRASELKNQFCCRQGHVLGVVVNERVGKKRRPELRLAAFRVALSQTATVPAGIVFAKVDEGEVMCGICGEVRHWHSSR